MTCPPWVPLRPLVRCQVSGSRSTQRELATGLEPDTPGYSAFMKLIRSAAAIAIAKRLYEEARKPQNQAKLKAAIDRARSKNKPRGK